MIWVVTVKVIIRGTTDWTPRTTTPLTLMWPQHNSPSEMSESQTSDHPIIKPRMYSYMNHWDPSYAKVDYWHFNPNNSVSMKCLHHTNIFLLLTSFGRTSFTKWKYGKNWMNLWVFKKVYCRKHEDLSNKNILISKQTKNKCSFRVRRWFPLCRDRKFTTAFYSNANSSAIVFLKSDVFSQRTII